MNREQHIAEAERLLKMAKRSKDWDEGGFLAAAAQVHATLAVAIGEPKPVVYAAIHGLINHHSTT